MLTAVVGLWITTGQNFSTTLKRAPGLPPGPTDRCVDAFSYEMTNITIQTTPWTDSNYNTTESITPWTDYHYSTPESTAEYETKRLKKPWVSYLDRTLILGMQWCQNIRSLLKLYKYLANSFYCCWYIFRGFQDFRLALLLKNINNMNIVCFTSFKAAQLQILNLYIITYIPNIKCSHK